MQRSIQSLIRLSCLYKKQIFVLFFLSLSSSIFFLIGPYLSKLFIEEAFLEKNVVKFLNISICGVVIFFLSTLFKVIEDIVKNRIAIKLKLNLANRFIKKLYSLNLSFFQSRSAGENVYQLADTERIANFILQECPSVLLDIFKLPIILGISLWINATLTLFLIILSPLFLIHNVCLRKRLESIYEEIWKQGALISQKVYEAFSRILIIKAFGLETYQSRLYLRVMIKNIRLGIRNFRWSIISSVSSSFLSKAIYGAITLYGGWLIIKGKLTIGSYTAVMLYLTQAGGLLESLSYRFRYLIQETVSLERFFEIIDIPPPIENLGGLKILHPIKGEIRFNNIWFGYQKERPIFKGLNFTIPGFSWVAIVGQSGCGKTTLVNLILRLYEPLGGEIILDGLDLKKINLKSLREKIAIATQQPLLFNVSIKENISYGLRDIQEEKIIEASRISGIYDFISQLPKGYDTVIGEDGCFLSEGLKQRIAIARAILRNPQLLILDEATSSVDSSIEEKIFLALRQKRLGQSTIIISHRLFSIKDADRIYFLKGNGEIAEGSHLQLLSKDTLYRDFFRHQIDKPEEQNYYVEWNSHSQ